MSWLFSRKLSTQRVRTPRPLLQLERLEEREVPAGVFLTGVGSATNPAEPFARRYDTTNPNNPSLVTLPGEFNAFPGFPGSVRVASGDVNGDGTDDIITAQGPGNGSGSQIRIFDGASAVENKVANEIASFFAYSSVAGAGQTPGFSGGVFVAAEDFNGDGFDELVTTPGAGARGHLKVFDFNAGGPFGTFLGSNPNLRTSFFAYTDFAGEIRVTTLKIANVPFIVTASGAGITQSDVRFYGASLTGSLNPLNIGSVPDGAFVLPALHFFAFPGYTGGLSLAAGDTNLDGRDELFVSKNDGISTVRVYDITALALGGTTPPASREFVAFPGFLGEVRLGAADVDGNGTVEVLTSTGSSPGAQGSHIKAWDVTGQPFERRSFFAYQGYTGGVYLSTNDFTFTNTFVINGPITLLNGILNLGLPNLLEVELTNPGTFTRAKEIIVTLTGPGGQILDVTLSPEQFIPLGQTISSIPLGPEALALITATFGPNPILGAGSIKVVL